MTKTYLIALIVILQTTYLGCSEIHQSDDLGPPLATFRAKLVGEMPSALKAERLRAAVLWVPEIGAHDTFAGHSMFTQFGCTERRTRSPQWEDACRKLQSAYQGFIQFTPAGSQRIPQDEGEAEAFADYDYLHQGSVAKFINADAELGFPTTIELEQRLVPFDEKPDGTRRPTNSVGTIVVYEDDGNGELDLAGLKDKDNSPDRVVAVSAVPGIQTDDNDVLFTSLVYAARTTSLSKFYAILGWLDTPIWTPDLVRESSDSSSSATLEGFESGVWSEDSNCEAKLQEGFYALTISLEDDGRLRCRVDEVDDVRLALYYLDDRHAMPLCTPPFYRSVYPVKEPPKNSDIECLSRNVMRFEIRPATDCAATFTYRLQSSCEQFSYNISNDPPEWWPCEDVPYEETTNRLAAGKIAMSNDTVCIVDPEDRLLCWDVAAGTGGCWSGEQERCDIEAPVDGKVVQVSLGSTYGCAVTESGIVMCWGELLLGTPVTQPQSLFAQVSATGQYPCGVRTDGQIECWQAPKAAECEVPCVSGFETETRVFDGDFLQVATNSRGSICAIRSDHSLVCLNRTDKLAIPEGRFSQITPFRWGFCALRTDGRTVCFGDGKIYSAPLGRFTLISGGTYQACGLREDGKAECWGLNTGTYWEPPSGRFVDLAFSMVYGCGVHEDGSVACWTAGGTIIGE